MKWLFRVLTILTILLLAFGVAFLVPGIGAEDALVLGVIFSFVTIVLRFLIVKAVPLIGRLFGKTWTWKPGRIAMTGLLVLISLGYAFYKADPVLPPFGDAPFIWLGALMGLVDGMIAWATVIYNFGLKYVNDWLGLAA